MKAEIILFSLNDSKDQTVEFDIPEFDDLKEAAERAYYMMQRIDEEPCLVDQLGCRSMMVGDLIEINNKLFIVDLMDCVEVEEWQARNWCEYVDPCHRLMGWKWCVQQFQYMFQLYKREV